MVAVFIFTASADTSPKTEKSFFLDSLPLNPKPVVTSVLSSVQDSYCPKGRLSQSTSVSETWMEVSMDLNGTSNNLQAWVSREDNAGRATVNLWWTYSISNKTSDLLFKRIFIAIKLSYFSWLLRRAFLSECSCHPQTHIQKKCLGDFILSLSWLIN